MDVVIDHRDSEHVVSDPSYFRDVRQVARITVELVSGTSITAASKVKRDMDTRITQVEMTNACYIPTMKMNILRTSRLDERWSSTKIE